MIMKPKELLEFLHTVEKLKCVTRHSWTSDARRESVAEHSFRLAVAAMFVKDEFPEVDGDKLLRMCLIHDFGEAIHGDVPSFLKTATDERREENDFQKVVSALPESHKREISDLYSEFLKGETTEAKIATALDKLEAAISHNEAPIETWLPLEYELNPVYGKKECAFSDFLAALQREAENESFNKIAAEAEKF